jgi:hypothetical protein
MDNKTFINIVNSQSILLGVRLKLQEKRILNLTDKHKRKYHYIAPYFSRNEDIN